MTCTAVHDALGNRQTVLATACLGCLGPLLHVKPLSRKKHNTLAKGPKQSLASRSTEANVVRSKIPFPDSRLKIMSLAPSESGSWDLEVGTLKLRVDLVRRQQLLDKKAAACSRGKFGTEPLEISNFTFWLKYLSFFPSLSFIQNAFHSPWAGLNGSCSSSLPERARYWVCCIP